MFFLLSFVFWGILYSLFYFIGVISSFDFLLPVVLLGMISTRLYSIEKNSTKIAFFVSILSAPYVEQIQEELAEQSRKTQEEERGKVFPFKVVKNEDEKEDGK